MRIAPVVLGLLIAGTAAAALPRVAPEAASRHRGEHVTLAGPVNSVDTRPDGTVLMIGTDAFVAVRITGSVRERLGRPANDLIGHDVELSGTLTPADQPLELVLDRSAQAGESGGATENVETLRERVHQLENEVARLRAAQPEDLKSTLYGPSGPVVYGASGTARAGDVQLYAPLTRVLAARGVPTRTGWGPQGAILFYGRDRYIFDDKQQLIGIRRD